MLSPSLEGSASSYGSEVARRIRVRAMENRDMAIRNRDLVERASVASEQAEAQASFMTATWNDFSLTQMLPITDVSPLVRTECDSLTARAYCACTLRDLKCEDTGTRPSCPSGSAVPILSSNGTTGFYCAVSRDDPVVESFLEAVSS